MPRLEIKQCQFYHKNNLKNNQLNFFKGIHAREWIAPAVTSFLIRELLENDGKKYLDYFNFYIVPVTNPDGYEFSRSHVSTNKYFNKGRENWAKLNILSFTCKLFNNFWNICHNS